MTLSKILAAGAAAAALVAFAGGANAATIINGSFEAGSGDAGLGGFSTLGGGSTAITGWTVDANSVDWINGYWQASNGTHSVDLNGTGLGGVSQTIATTPGQSYVVTFDISGNPDVGSGVRTLQVSAGGAPQTYTYAFTTPPNDHANMNWQSEAFRFTAQGPSTTLSFDSTSLDNCCWGPALDNVSISAVPETSTWAMAIIGFAMLGAVVRRRPALARVRA